RNNALIKITSDHSTIGFKEDKGFLTEEEAMRHPQRNEISKMLGEYMIDANDTDAYFDFFEHSFLPGDIVLFCSDGLTDLVNRQGITVVLSRDISLKDKAQQLIDSANGLGGKDNITVALAGYEAKKAAKKVYKNTIEVPINEEENLLTIMDKKPARKKKQWLWLLPAVFLAGFLANWAGTKKILRPGNADRVDTVYVRDTIPYYDSLAGNDTLIQATDTIFSGSSRNRNTTGY